MIAMVLEVIKNYFLPLRTFVHDEFYQQNLVRKANR